MKQPHVLIVEDEGVVALDLSRRLQSMGWANVSMVQTGADALQHVIETHVDLILMDIGLRGSIDGAEAAERILQKQDIPVVYVTADSDDETLERTRRTSPSGYVWKPLEDSKLRTTIEKALGRHSKRKATGVRMEGMERPGHGPATSAASNKEYCVLKFDSAVGREH